MALAAPLAMRFAFAIATAVLALASNAAAEPLWTAELRTGYGISIGGGAGMSSVRTSPFDLELAGAIAVVEEPRILAEAGVIAELGDRTAAGGFGRARIEPRWHGLRLSTGLTYIASPYTLWGPSFSLGDCQGAHPLSVCADLQATVFVGGSDLPDDKAATQIQLMIGIGIDG